MLLGRHVWTRTVLSLGFVCSLDHLLYPGKPRDRLQCPDHPLKPNTVAWRLQCVNYFGYLIYFRISMFLSTNPFLFGVTIKLRYTLLLTPCFTNTLNTSTSIVISSVINLSLVSSPLPFFLVVIKWLIYSLSPSLSKISLICLASWAWFPKLHLEGGMLQCVHAQTVNDDGGAAAAAAKC